MKITQRLLFYLTVTLIAALVIECLQGCSSTGSSRAQIIDAVNRGNLSQVRTLVARDPSLVNTLIEGDAILRQPILSRAIELENGAMAAYLVSNGADVNAPDKQGWVPLHYAAKWGDVSIIKLLLSKGANLNISANGSTPLVVATNLGKEYAANELILAGAMVNIRDEYGLFPSDYAIKNGMKSTYLLLKKHGCKSRMLPILEYSALGDVEGIRKELTRDPSLLHIRGASDWRPLHYAAQSGEVAALKLLLAKGATADEESLQCAVESGNMDAVRLLLSSGCDINGKPRSNSTVLTAAVCKNDPRMVDFLLAAGTDPSIPSSTGETPEELAKSYGYRGVVKVFSTHTAKGKGRP